MVVKAVRTLLWTKVPRILTGSTHTRTIRWFAQCFSIRAMKTLTSGFLRRIKDMRILETHFKRITYEVEGDAITTPLAAP